MTMGGIQAKGGTRPGAVQRRDEVTLDLVIPVHDEEPVLPALLGALAKTFAEPERSRLGITAVTCLFVDDGSGDRSVETIQDCAPEGLGIRILRLSRNFGHQAAISAGLAHSTADLVVVMDADLQDPPECVVEMVDRWREGYEVAYGQRRNREASPVLRILYPAFYRLFRWLSPIDVPVDAGDFSLMSRRVVDELNRLPESLRFPRGLRAWLGFPQIAVAYDRPARKAGQSSYGWRDLYHLATEGIASLSVRPLKIAQVLALVYLLLAGLGVSALLFNLFGETELRTQLSIVILLLLTSNSLILFCMYILGAYLGRAYTEVKGRPAYVVYEDLEVAPSARSGRAPGA
jgi:glycosyltransferase involved in cell wall biosynthesis